MLFYGPFGGAIALFFTACVIFGIIKYQFSGEAQHKRDQAAYDRHIKQAIRLSRETLARLSLAEQAEFDLCAYAETLAKKCWIRTDTAMLSAIRGGLLFYKGALIHQELLALSFRERPNQNFDRDFYMRLASQYKILPSTAENIVHQCWCIYQFGNSEAHYTGSFCLEEELVRQQACIREFVDHALSSNTLYPLWDWGLMGPVPNDYSVCSAVRAAKQSSMTPYSAFLRIVEELERRGIPVTPT